MEDEFGKGGKSVLMLFCGWMGWRKRDFDMGFRFLLRCDVRTLFHLIYMPLLSAIIESASYVKIKCACYTLLQFVASDLGLGFMYHTARLALNKTKHGLHSSVSTSLRLVSDFMTS